MAAQNLVNNNPGAWYEVRASELRAIAGTVETTYPSAADTLRGIANGLVTNRPKQAEQQQRGPDTKTGVIGFAVFVLCFCAVIVMLTIKLGVVLFN